MPNINSLYELIKQKSQELGRPLKVICDWDECLQSREPQAYFIYAKENLGNDFTQQFGSFLEEFWEKATVTYRDHRHATVDTGNVLIENLRKKRTQKEVEEQIKDIKAREDFYKESNCFLNIAEDLLLFLEQDLIEGKNKIDADIAYRLGRYFQIEPVMFLNLQQIYDLEVWKDRQGETVKKQVHPYRESQTA